MAYRDRVAKSCVVRDHHFLKQDTQEKPIDGEEQGDAESFVPDAKFEPVIPLPDLVKVKTGEEEERVCIPFAIFSTPLHLIRT